MACRTVHDDSRTDTLAEYLGADLQRITRSANDQLRTIQLAKMPDFVRQAEEARVIDEARARAVRRIESTIRELHAIKAPAPVEHERPQDVESLGAADLEKTQIIPAVTDVETPVDASTDAAPEPQKAVEGERDKVPVGGVVAGHVGAQEDRPDGSKGRHRAWDDDNDDEATTAPRPEPLEAPVAAAASKPDDERLQELLAFVVRQELDLLRANLDTARYQLLIQYPNLDPALFLNCLLLAATERAVTGDSVSANYHLAWFHRLNAPTGSPRAAKQ